MLISFEKWEELIKNGYSLDVLYFLQLLEEGYESTEIASKSPKFNTLWSSLLRKGLVTDEGKVTLEGKNLLSLLSEEVNKPKLRKKKTESSEFISWWNTYPSTDTFEYKGRKFTGSRALRVKKDDCRVKLNKILNEGEYTIDELVEALKLEVEQKAEASIKEGKNKISFFQNSLTYLNQATYDPFVDLVRKGYKAKTEDNRSTVEGVEI